MVYWAYPTIVVQDTSDLIALYLPAGALGKDVLKKPTPQELMMDEVSQIVDYEWNQTDVLMLIVPGESFSIYAMWDTESKVLVCWYINLQEPIRHTSIGFDTMDHMLDIVVSPDLSSWKWKDDDEFAEAERIGFYTPQAAAQIRHTGEKAADQLLSERRSFYQKWETWQPPPGWEIPQLSPEWDKIELQKT
jgi:protein associated with RNAse G/E